MTTRLEWAQWMIERGMTVFICEEDSKHPLGGRSWKSHSTTDPLQIAEWFEQYPNCNYGVWPKDEYVVVDLDRKPSVNGIALFEEICTENGIDAWELELNTFTVKTPSGGYHLYFKVESPVANANNLPKGIDIRGAVGFVVGPGSTIIKVRGEEPIPYSVINDARIMDCPSWLSAYMKGPNYKDPNRHNPHVEYDLPENIAQALGWLEHADVANEGQEGNQRTYNVSCQLRDFGISEEMIFQLLLDEEHCGTSWNQRCDPPWDDGELKACIDHSQRYASNRPGCASITLHEGYLNQVRPAGGYKFSEAKMDTMYDPKSAVDKVVDNSLEDRRRRKKAEAEEDFPSQEDDGADAQESPDETKQLWYDMEDFAGRDNIREYVIKDWLIAHGVTALLAKRGTGKSTIALDIGMHLAKDMDWYGTRTMKGWKVIYICGEDDEGMILNCRAWAKHEDRGLPARGRFLVAADIIKMTDGRVLAKRMQEMVTWADGARCVIILDTWARATSGFSANTQEEMDTAYENAEKVARAVQGPMIACFHPPKEGNRLTIRGSAVQEDASSGIWNLTEEAGSLKLWVARIKGKGYGRYRNFQFKTIDLEGKDFYGEKLEGIVPIKTGGTEDEGSDTAIDLITRQRRAWAEMVIGCYIFPADNGHYPKLNKMNRESISNFISKVWQDYQERDEDGDVVDKDAEEFVQRFMQAGIEMKWGEFLGTATRVKRRIRDLFFEGESRAVVFEGRYTVYIKDGEFVVEAHENTEI